MKLYVEDKTTEIDGKKIDYKAIGVKVDLGSPIGEYIVGLKFETKQEKENILNNIDIAEFDIENKVSGDKVYIRPIIKIGTITFKPKMSQDSLILLRLALQK